jgi:hypothetical protein
MRYFGFADRGVVEAPSSPSRGVVEAPPSPDVSKILTISKVYSIGPLAPKESPFKMGVIASPTGGTAPIQQPTMYQCPNGKVISTPDISLCEETPKDSGFSKYLIPAGIALVAILLLK